LHPKRKEYPGDFVAFFRRRFLGTLAITSHHHIVTHEVIEGRDTITGYAEWARLRAGDKDQQDVPSTPGEYCLLIKPRELYIDSQQIDIVRLSTVLLTQRARISSHVQRLLRGISGRELVPKTGCSIFSWWTLRTSVKALGASWSFTG
jgi:hypothetical protein